MILVNGEASACIAPDDRGFHYGDGLFETMAVEDGQALCLERHLDRLSHGCTRLAIPFPCRRTLREEIQRVAVDMPRAVVKVIVTRGAGARGYRVPSSPAPTRLVASYQRPRYPRRLLDHGVRVCFCSQRLSENPHLAGLKHLNRLEQVLARREVDDSGAEEGLMLDAKDFVTAGTMSNLFLVQGGNLVTPALSRCGVEGVIRGIICDIALERNAVPVRIERVRRETLYEADEVFLSNSVFGIWTVSQLDDRRLAPGPVARSYRNELLARGAIAGG